MTIVKQAWQFTGAQQTFVVPNGVTSIRWEAWGAMGADVWGGGNTQMDDFSDNNCANNQLNVNSGGGLGSGFMQGSGYVAGTLAVTPGDTYYLYVGGNGYQGEMDSVTVKTQVGGNGGWNGGGKGGNSPRASGTSTSQIVSGGAGGGGATDVRYGGTALSNRILVAGGTGGCGGYGYDNFATGQTFTVNPSTPQPPYSDASTTVDSDGYYVPSRTDGTYPTWYLSSGHNYGGWGGAATAGAGAGGWGSSFTVVSSTGGKGGSASAGGAGGTATGTYGIAGAAGTSGTGGAGAACTATSVAGKASLGGGGGGGGYYGGGGGANGYANTSLSGWGGGGGGGSNYVSGAFTATVTEPHTFPEWEQYGYLNTDMYEINGLGGFIRITYTQPPNAPAISFPTDYSNITASDTLTVAWTFSSNDPNAYSYGFDIEYKLDTGSTWTLIHSGAYRTTTYTFAGNTFTAGNVYDIQVRTYDQNGDVSPWSEVHVTAVQPPVAPTITSPAAGAVITSDTVTLNWTNPSGSRELTYEVTLLNAESRALIYDSGPVNTANRINLAYNPNFEHGVAAWQYPTGTTGVTITQSTTYAKSGTHSMKYALGSSGMGTPVGWNLGPTAVYTAINTVPGMTYAVTASVATDTYTVAADLPLLMAGTPDGTMFVWVDTGSGQTWTANGQWLTLQGTFIATQSVTLIGLYDTDASRNVYVDNVIVEPHLSGAYSTYFDGDNANGNTGTVSWQGTAGNSASLLTNTDTLSWTTGWQSVHGWKSQPVKAYISYSNFVSQGLPSVPKEVDFTVNLNPPGVPTVVLTPNPDTGSITLDITCPTVPYATTNLEVYRTDLTNGTPEVKLAIGIVPDATHKAQYVDHTPATRVSYQYRVRAIAASGGYADAT